MVPIWPSPVFLKGKFSALQKNICLTSVCLLVFVDLVAALTNLPKDRFLPSLKMISLSIGFGQVTVKEILQVFCCFLFLFHVVY